MNLRFRVTNQGAAFKNAMYAYGRCFQLTGFQLGSGGHDTVTGLPYTVDLTQTRVLFPITGILALSQASLSTPDPRHLGIALDLDGDTGNGVFSQLGIYGEIVHTVNPNETNLLGTRCLYAVANFPAISKSVGQTKSILLSLNTAS